MIETLGAVRQWILLIGKNDESVLGFRLADARKKDWQEIAAKVRLRKTLILEAAEDLFEGLEALKALGCPRWTVKTGH